MGRFRRRKPTVAWLPHVQHDAQNDDIGWWQSAINVSATNNGLTTAVLALTVDYPAEAIRQTGGQTPSLADYMGSGFRLRRIVGKIFAGMENEVGGANPDDRVIACLFGCGFIVLRVDEVTGAPLRATINDYSPLRNESTSDPWIWRRTWVLQNDFAREAGSPQDTWQFPRTNCEYGSVQDGPHIDAKTARRVTDEERLFFVVSTVNLSGTATLAGAVRFILDYRILGSLIKTSGNRRNASR